MNIDMLVQLAEEDHPVLVALINRWKSAKQPDPVPDARALAASEEERRKKWPQMAWVSLIAAGLAFLALSFLVPWLVHGEVTPIIYGGAVLIAAVITLVVCIESLCTERFIYQSCENPANVEAFCYAVSRIEDLLGAELVSKRYLASNALSTEALTQLEVWKDERALEVAALKAIDYLKSEAAKVARLQPISYRREEAETAYELLMGAWKDLTRLLRGMPTHRELFTERQGEAPAAA